MKETTETALPVPFLDIYLKW